MPGAGKLRPRRSEREGGEWPAQAPAAPEPILASPTKPRFRALKRLFQGMLILIPIVGIAAPVYLWFQYQSHHVTSSNAVVRGHLAEVGTRLNGLIVEVAVDAGDRVTKGQVLARLEDRHLLAEVQEARAEVDGLQRTIEVERMTIGHERRQIQQQAREAQAYVSAADAEVSAARVRVDDARRTHETRETLFSRDGVVSNEDVRDADGERRKAEALFDAATANSVAARSAREKIQLNLDAVLIREHRTGILEADLLRAQARLTRAEADLDGAVIRAPQDGAIVRRIIEPGGSVEVGQPVIAMWLGDDVWVEAWIEEDDISAVRLGNPATVTLHSFPGSEFAGTVDKIGLATDYEMPESDVPQPRFARMRGAPVVGVRIRLENPPLDLLPGLSAVVAIRRPE